AVHARRQPAEHRPRHGSQQRLPACLRAAGPPGRPRHPGPGARQDRHDRARDRAAPALGADVARPKARPAAVPRADALSGRPAARWRRLMLLLIVAVGLSSVWIRSPRPPEMSDERQVLEVTPLRVPEVNLGDIDIVGAWQLKSPNRHFGSYS